MHRILKRDPALMIEDDSLVFPTLQDYYSSWETVIERIPAAKRVNQCITIYHYADQWKFAYQDILPIDIDHVDQDRLQEYRDAVQAALGIDKGNFVTVCTGNGIHCLIGLSEHVLMNDHRSFKIAKKIYSDIASQVEEELVKRGLDCEHNKVRGRIDRLIFSMSKTTRVIGSINRKEGQNDTTVSYLGGKIVYDYKLSDLCKKDTTGAAEIIKQMPTFYDAKFIVGACLFLKYCKENPEKVSYIQWLAMLSTLCKLDGGVDLCHSYSEKHPDYNYDTTEEKIESVLKLGYSCDGIGENFPGCVDCPFYKKIRFPLEIKGEDFIATKDSFFRRIQKNGKAPLEILDAVKYLPVHVGGFYLSKNSNIRFTYNKDTKVWEELKNSKSFDELRKIFADLTNWDFRIADFLDFSMKVNEKYSIDDEQTTYSNLVNMQNGVVDLKTRALLPHNPMHLFHTCLPYAYSATAICPRWNIFLDQICEGHKGKINLLQEYAAYCLFSPELDLSKMLFLIGPGQNGKTLFANVISAVMGRDKVVESDIAILNDKQGIGLLQHKRLFICNEVPARKTLAQNILKVLVEGGTITASPKYVSQFSFRNTAKLLILGNTLPLLDETDNATRRRMVICRLDRIITDEEKNINLFEELCEELPGIFNWLLQGYDNLRNRGDFLLPAEVKELTNQYIEEQSFDWVKECLGDMLERDTTGSSPIKLTDIFCKVKEYGELNGYDTRKADANRISTKLRQMFRGSEIRKVWDPTLRNAYRKICGVKYIAPSDF